MRRKILALILCVVTVLGCSCSFKVTKSTTEPITTTVDVDTGDTVKITIKNIDKENIKTVENGFAIVDDEGQAVVVQWHDASQDTIEALIERLEGDDKANIVTKSDNEVVWQYGDEAYDKVLKLSPRTNVQMMSPRKPKEAQAMFDNISFEVIKGSAEEPTEEQVDEPVKDPAGEKIGEMTFTLPDGFEITEGSIDNNKSYFKGTEALFVIAYQDNYIDVEKELEPGGEMKTIAGHEGYFYKARMAPYNFVFMNGDYSYIISADSNEVLESVVASAKF